LNPAEPAKRIGSSRRLGWVAGLTVSDAAAIAIGLLTAGLLAPMASPAYALDGTPYQLLPPDTIPIFLTLQIAMLAVTGTYAGRLTNGAARIGLASVIGSVLFLAALSRHASLALPWESWTLAAGSAILSLLLGRRVARSVYRKLRRTGIGLPRVALITTQSGAEKDALRIARQPKIHVRVCETIVVERPANGGARLALRALDRINSNLSLAGVVVSVDAPPRLMETVLDGCLERGLPLFVVPPFQQVFSRDVRAVTSGSLTIIRAIQPFPAFPRMAWKRFIDVVGAGLGLLLLSPLFFLLGILIKLDSPGPVFFAQERVGLGGRPFRMLKFRTMVDGADSHKEDFARLNGSGDTRLFKIEHDPRVTRLGRLLRKYSLDELPQLWNVIRREMSLVGPRPFFRDDLTYYAPHHLQRYGVLPGITGQWQVNGRSNIKDFEAVVAQDLDYIKNWSISRDLGILCKTLPAVFRAEGAM